MGYFSVAGACRRNYQSVVICADSSSRKTPVLLCFWLFESPIIESGHHVALNPRAPEAARRTDGRQEQGCDARGNGAVHGHRAPCGRPARNALAYELELGRAAFPNVTYTRLGTPWRATGIWFVISAKKRGRPRGLR
jgi:hypothetical protein